MGTEPWRHGASRVLADDAVSGDAELAIFAIRAVVVAVAIAIVVAIVVQPHSAVVVPPAMLAAILMQGPLRTPAVVSLSLRHGHEAHRQHGTSNGKERSASHDDSSLGLRFQFKTRGASSRS